MGIAWTTLLVIALLAPGLFFLLGIASRERVSRELLKTSTLGEIVIACLIAAVLHLIGWLVLKVLGLNGLLFVRPLLAYEVLPKWIAASVLMSALPGIIFYLIVTSAFGFFLGWIGSSAIVDGPLRMLARHKWAYDLLSGDNVRLITAYVMTKMTCDDKTLMYKGRLREFYLNGEGQFSYVVLSNCSRFYMKSTGDIPKTGEQIEIFRSDDLKSQVRIWNYLQIDGSNIANVLFDKSYDIDWTSEGEEALDTALSEPDNESETRPASPIAI